jgi:hypothetical protein
VYDHARGEWRAPKRWIRYDGSPRDVLLMALLGIPLAAVLAPPVRWLVVATLLVGVAYGLLRRRLAAIAPAVFGAVPELLAHRVPDRYHQ